LAACDLRIACVVRIDSNTLRRAADDVACTLRKTLRKDADSVSTNLRGTTDVGLSTGGCYNRWNQDGRCYLKRRCNGHRDLRYYHRDPRYYHWKLKPGYYWLIEAMSGSKVNLATRFHWRWDDNRRDLSNTDGWWWKIHCCIFSFVGLDEVEFFLFVSTLIVHDAEEGLVVAVIDVLIFVVHDDDVDVRSDKL